MDNHSKEVRSYNMSEIRSTGTKPEEIVRKYLFSKGLRYRKNVKILPRKPDIVFSKYKTVVFVNGCFWHGHQNCRYFVMPKSNTEYWESKIKSNRLYNFRPKYFFLHGLYSREKGLSLSANNQSNVLKT